MLNLTIFVKFLLLQNVLADYRDVILDIASGTGDISKLISKEYPDTSICMSDINFDMLSEGRDRAINESFDSNCSFCQLNGENLLFVPPDNYQMGFSDEKNDMYISEWFLDGQTQNDWSEMVTVQVFYNYPTREINNFGKSLENLSKFYGSGVYLGGIWGVSGGFPDIVGSDCNDHTFCSHIDCNDHACRKVIRLLRFEAARNPPCRIFLFAVEQSPV